MDREKQLMDLNDDCLLAIFFNLTVFEYWLMRKVCRRFHQLITNAHCPPQYKHWMDAKSIDDTEIDGFETLSLVKFQALLDDMSDVVEHVEVQMLSDRHLRMLEKHGHQMPEVRILKVRVPFSTRKYEGLDVAAILAKTFSKVESLTFVGALKDATGLTEMCQLKKLELYCDDAYDSTLDNLAIIFERCALNAITIQHPGRTQHCKWIGKCANTLKEIAVSSDFLHSCLREIAQTPMPRLERFAYIDVELLEGEEGCFAHNLLGPFAERIYRFASNFEYIPFPIDVLSDLLHLEELIISDRGVTCQNEKRLTEYFPHLTQVQCWNRTTYFEKYCEEEDEDDDGEATPLNTLTLLMSLNQNLRMLAVPIEWIGERFTLLQLSEALEKQEERKCPLELRCLVHSDTSASERRKVLQSYEPSELLQISFSKLPDEWQHWDSITRHYFDFYLKPMTSS